MATAAVAPISYSDPWLEVELVKLRAGAPELVPAARRAVRGVLESIVREAETEETHTARALLATLTRD